MRGKLKKMTHRTAFAAASVLILGACAYPTSTVVQGGTSSAIYFESFPPTASVTVDGQYVGTVSDFDGVDQTLAVAAGTHVVRITDGPAVLLDKKVYVGRDSALKISR
jgi:hypothetical protein